MERSCNGKKRGKIHQRADSQFTWDVRLSWNSKPGRFDLINDCLFPSIPRHLTGGSRPSVVPYQPPHWGASWFDASTLAKFLLPQKGHFNSFSSLGPNGTGTSKLDWHWWQMSCQVTIISRSFSCGIDSAPDAPFLCRSHKQMILDRLNIKSKIFCVNRPAFIKTDWFLFHFFNDFWRFPSPPPSPTRGEGKSLDKI